MERIVAIVLQKGMHSHFSDAAGSIAEELSKNGWAPFSPLNSAGICKICKRIIVIVSYSCIASVLNTFGNNDIELVGVLEGSTESLNFLRKNLDGHFSFLISPKIGELVDFITK